MLHKIGRGSQSRRPQLHYHASFRLAERSQGALAEFSTLNFNLLPHLQIATANTAKNPPKSTPILLSTAIVDRASGLQIPRRPGTRLGQQRRQGSATGRAWHASGRISRCAPSAATQERVADPEPPAQGSGSSSSAPPGSSQHHRAHAVAAGKSCGLPEGHGRPPAAPRPSSRPALPSHLPRACPSGLCCWLLLLAAGAHHVRPGGPVAQPHHNRRLSSAHGARLGPRTLPLGQSVGARPPPSQPPHLLPPAPNPPPTHVLGQPLRSR